MHNITFISHVIFNNVLISMCLSVTFILVTWSFLALYCKFGNCVSVPPTPTPWQKGVHYRTVTMRGGESTLLTVLPSTNISCPLNLSYLYLTEMNFPSANQIWSSSQEDQSACWARHTWSASFLWAHNIGVMWAGEFLIIYLAAYPLKRLSGRRADW